MTKSYRYYQQDADDAIFEELQNSDKCLVKMFCGTGKSLLMRNCAIAKNKSLVVYVMPSLPLIGQFYDDYFKDSDNILRISSDKGSTTDILKISTYLNNKNIPNKIICITYKSFQTLLENLNGIQIDVGIFDEAHRVVGETYQQLIFENNLCDKQIFFTATPKNANGIIMYDRDNLEKNMCGKLVYDYSYLRGVNEGYLNPFEIRIDMYTENTNKSVFETIARAILSSRNNRVLTFHKYVNTGRDTSVQKFVDEKEFKKIFKEIQVNEFPNLKIYKKIKMIALDSSILSEKRKKILLDFDKTPDDNIYVISSCQTIGEGIDTKNANMCVFVDPKSFYVPIIQNIGRIVRKTFGDDKPNSTVLIPCWVDKAKYLDCNGDKDKCDEVIRQDIGESGNFNGILNVLSALRQEDEDLYDICLHYPDTFSPQEIKGNLEKQGFEIGDIVGDGSLIDTIEHIADMQIDTEILEDCDTDDIIMNIAKDNDICIEVHTNSLENPIQTYNSDCGSDKVVRLFKNEDNDENDTPVYQPIVSKDGTKCGKKSETISKPNKNKRTNIKVHTNPDVKVLWNIVDGFDLTKNICSCVLDCEVVDTWYENFEELKQFIDENKRRPSYHSKKENEKKIGCWLTRQQTNYRRKKESMNNIEKYTLWTMFLEEYKEYVVTDEELWGQNFVELKQFINENKRTPTTTKENEKKIGSWLSTQQKNYKKKTQGMTDENRYNMWTKFLEEYKEYFELWGQNFVELKQFINENKRTPTTTKENEKKIASWLYHEQKNYKNKTHGMKDENRYNMWTEFLEEYKEYFELWGQNFVELKQFINENKRTPIITKENEKKIGTWLSTQQRNYKKKKEGMKDENRYNIWTEFLEEYKEYFVSSDELWGKNFVELTQFINENKKTPTRTKENEKKIGTWLYTQQKNYKNKTQGMKDETRYNIWTEFLEEYKEYFNKDTSTTTDNNTTNVEEIIEIIPVPKKSMKLTKSKKTLEKQFKETPEQKRQRTKSELSVLHQKYKTLKSSNLQNTFKEDIQLWYNYHQISEENEKSFPEDEIPRNRIIQELNKIKTKRRKVVVDMGCGKAQISEYYKDDNRFEFINYDHIAVNDNVQECDISKLPLEDDAVEICILSLAMWGSNCREYIMEANRILESGGTLYIIEPTKRWSNKDETGNIINEGCKLKTLLEENSFKIVEESINKFYLLKCVK
jgi:superfamily II DNA or RNA helicase